MCIVDFMEQLVYTKGFQVLVILSKCFKKARRFVVKHTMLLAHFLHNRLNVRMMAVIDAREKMVLDLQVESACEKVYHPSSDRRMVSKTV